jgi:hypothetical protein
MNKYAMHIKWRARLKAALMVLQGKPVVHGLVLIPFWDEATFKEMQNKGLPCLSVHSLAGINLMNLAPYKSSTLYPLPDGEADYAIAEFLRDGTKLCPKCGATDTPLLEVK